MKNTLSTIKKRIKNLFPFFFFPFLLSSIMSCESVVSDYLGLPEPIEKLVVHSFISPQDTMLFVKVTTSSPVFGVFRGNNFTGYTVNGKDTIYFKGDALENAKVTLTSPTSSVSLTFLKKEAVYAIDAKKFKIEAGKTYNLRVEASGKIAESSCTIPSDVIKIKKYSIDSVKSQGIFGEPDSKSINVSYEWDDLKGKENYYFVKANIYTDVLSPINKNGQTVFEIKKRYYQANWNGEDFFNDIGLDGTTFTTKGEINLRFQNQGRGGQGGLGNNGNNVEEKPIGGKYPVRMELLNVDVNYYKYHLSVRQNRQGDSNPFIEPTPMYNNIKGGLGCFGASNESGLLVKF